MFVQKDLLHELEVVKNSISVNEKSIKQILEYLKQFEKRKQEDMEFQKRSRIGYKQTGE